LSEDGDSSGVLLDQVNLKTIANRPTTGRTVHVGRTGGGEDIALQNDVDVWSFLLQGTKRRRADNADDE